MKPSSRFGALLLCATAAIALIPEAAHAQAAEPQSGQGQGGEASNTIVVTAPRGETEARQVQFNAPNIIDVQSADAILKYPDINAAEAASRMPGVSLSSDTGEGRFLEIRGLDGNLNGATFGGVPLLNTNPGGTYFGGGGRAVEFDTVPTGSIDGMILTKTGLPNHEAEGLGGTLELTPRSAVSLSAPFLDAALGWGYEPAHDHTGPFNADLALGARFGLAGGFHLQNGEADTATNAPFSFVLTGSRRDDRRGFDDLEADYIDEALKPFDNLQLRRYDYHRRRFGYGGEFDYQPNDDHHYFIRANVAGYTESVYKNRLTYDVSDAGLPPIDPANSNGFVTEAALSIKGTNEQEAHRNSVIAAGGEDHFGDLAIDYRVAYSRATFTQQYNFGTTFAGPEGVAFKYDNVSDSDFPSVAITDGTDPNDSSLYTLAKLSNSSERDVDQERYYAVNASLPFRFFNDADRWQFGASARIRDKISRPGSEAFTLPSPKPTLTDFSASAVTDFYDGHYANGPQIDEKSIARLATAGPAASKGSELDTEAYFSATEDIYALYGMYTTQIGKLGLLAGVRGERTEADYGGYEAVGDGDPHIIMRSTNYNDWFPTVQARYTVTPDFLLRATYSTGVGRPGFLQNSSARQVNTDENLINAGNPDLRPTTGDNFDFSAEYYLSNGGIVQFGLFDKEFSDYIVPRVLRNVVDPAGVPAGNYEITTWENISSSYARGIEAAYQQSFTWLPAPFDGLGANANVTVVDSQVSLRDGEKTDLPGASSLTYNIAAFYEAHGLKLRLSGEYVGKNLFGIGDSRATDAIEDNRFTLDFTSSYDVASNWTVYFTAKNLTNEPLRSYLGSSDRPIQRELYEITYEAGLRAKF
jgi:TonB-dependent receptor